VAKRKITFHFCTASVDRTVDYYFVITLTCMAACFDALALVPHQREDTCDQSARRMSTFIIINTIHTHTRQRCELYINI